MQSILTDPEIWLTASLLLLGIALRPPRRLALQPVRTVRRPRAARR